MKFFMNARTRSFFAFFWFRQVLIPFSTVRRIYLEGGKFMYLDVYIFGFRIARLDRNA